MPCRLPGSATAMRSVPPSSAYGIATTRSRTWSGICSAASFATPDRRQVDERDLVADGERAGDPLGRCDTLVDDRLRERAVAGAAAHERELVGSDEPGCGEQVDDELGHRVDADARAERLRAGGGSVLAGRADRA